MYREGATQPRKPPPSTQSTVTTGPKPSTGGSTSPTRTPTSPASALRPRTRSESQPVGLPARSSRRRILAIRSSGVKRRPIAVNHCVTGSTTRSPKGRSSSRSRRSRRGRWRASTAASERATPLLGALSSTPLAAIASTIARKIRPSPAASCAVTSHLDLDDPGQPERADGEQHHGHDEHDSAERAAPQGTHIRGVGEGEVGEEHDRQPAEDPAGEPPLRGENLDLPAEPLALAQRVGHRRQQLGEVPADVPLDADRHDHPGEVLAGEP